MDSGNRVREHGRGWWGRSVALLLACACAAAAGACVKTPVRTAPPPEVAGLAVPVIPPRVFAPLPEEPVEEPQVAEPEEPRPAPVRQARPRPRAERPPETRPADPAKVEPVTPEPTQATPATPTPPLRTPQIADDSETGRRVRATIGRATAELMKVNTATMSGDARMQYETARRFVDQATGALDARNYMFAAYLADKAEALAKGLAGR